MSSYANYYRGRNRPSQMLAPPTENNPPLNPNIDMNLGMFPKTPRDHAAPPKRIDAYGLKPGANEAPRGTRRFFNNRSPMGFSPAPGIINSPNAPRNRLGHTGPIFGYYRPGYQPEPGRWNLRSPVYGPEFKRWQMSGRRFGGQFENNNYEDFLRYQQQMANRPKLVPYGNDAL